MKSTKCFECGFVGWSDVENCKACGAPLGQRSHNPPPAAPPYNSSYDRWNEPENPKKGMAIAGLVLGILSFFTFGLLGIGAIAGIILSCVAMSRAKRDPWKFGGHGMAIAGLVLSIVSLLTVVPIALIASIAIPNLLASRRAANEASAIYSVRQIASAEADYYNNLHKYATLEELATENLIDPRLASGTKHGYNFTLDVTNDETTPGFVVVGVPMTYNSTGRRSFYVDESDVVRAADKHGAPASKMDQPLGEDFYNGGGRQADYRSQPVY
jgi:type IV pilus assembly protein PilA